MSPILIITFNRPKFLERVLSIVREQRPNELFIFQDGARKGNDEDLANCLEVRRVISNAIDWSCSLHTFFSDKNLGCGPGPAAAITWFFDNVEQGIIIEDDAIPHPDFFQYAYELLEMYKDDRSVHAIGSMNVDDCRWSEDSYYFSMMNRNLCAWATWKRAWLNFDIRMNSVSRQQLVQSLRFYHCGILEREYWCDRLEEIHKDGCGGKSWDMQFLISIWVNHGKGIIPCVNLSSNIGTTENATHAMALGNIIDNVPTYPILPLKHPVSKVIQFEADRQFHFLYFEPNKKSWKLFKITYHIINKHIKSLFGHQGPWIKRQ